MSLGLIEENRSPQDVKIHFDLLLQLHNDVEITTLHDEILNIIGHHIYKGTLKNTDIEVRVYKNHKVVRFVKYDCDGYLSDDWPVGLLN